MTARIDLSAVPSAMEQAAAGWAANAAEGIAVAARPDGYLIVTRNGGSRAVRTRGGLDTAIANNRQRQIVGFWRVWLKTGRG